MFSSRWTGFFVTQNTTCSCQIPAYFVAPQTYTPPSPRSQQPTHRRSDISRPTSVHRTRSPSTMRCYALLATIFAATVGTSSGETSACKHSGGRCGCDTKGRSTYGSNSAMPLCVGSSMSLLYDGDQQRKLTTFPRSTSDPCIVPIWGCRWSALEGLSRYLSGFSLWWLNYMFDVYIFLVCNGNGPIRLAGTTYNYTTVDFVESP